MPRSYEILNLAERTPAWWEWRRSGIGSSDAATILGIKPAKSPERLLSEKQHSPASYERTFVRERGAALERAARASYSDATGAIVAPKCVQHLSRSWQRASLDGLSPDGERVVEIKCGAATFQSVAARGRPPRHHFAQLQHILSVTGLPLIDYWCYCPPRAPLLIEVRRDEPFIERLLVAEETFWKRLGIPLPISAR